jgi:hypothetical protein
MWYWYEIFLMVVTIHLAVLGIRYAYLRILRAKYDRI